MVLHETNDPNSNLTRIVEDEIQFNHRNITVYIEEAKIGDGILYLFNDRFVNLLITFFLIYLELFF